MGTALRPYDVTAVWIRNHHDGGWITATWVHRDLVRQPFSAAIYEHVRARSAGAGEPVRDDYIARRVAQMLDPEQTGQSPADKRMVARERNNPPRPPHLTVVTAPPVDDGAPQRNGDDHPTETVADQVGTTMGDRDQPRDRPSNVAVTGRRPGQGRNVVGFGVFDPTSDDWGFR